MKFCNEQHKQEFDTLVKRMGAERDIYRLTLAYLITADKVCSKHIENIYDFEERCILPECLSEGWQTGTTRKTLYLAFNLYNGSTAWTDEPEYVTPSEIFCTCLAPYYWEAIKIRYPEYTSE